MEMYHMSYGYKSLSHIGVARCRHRQIQNVFQITHVVR